MRCCAPRAAERKASGRPWRAGAHVKGDSLVVPLAGEADITDPALRDALHAVPVVLTLMPPVGCLQLVPVVEGEVSVASSLGESDQVVGELIGRAFVDGPVQLDRP